MAQIADLHDQAAEVAKQRETAEAKARELNHQLMVEEAAMAEEVAAANDQDDSEISDLPASPPTWRDRARMMAETARTPEELAQFFSGIGATPVTAATAAVPCVPQVQSSLPHVFLQQAKQRPAQARQPTLARTLQAQGHVVSSTSAMQAPFPSNTWNISTPERGRPGVRSRSTKREEQEDLHTDGQTQRRITRGMFGAAAARCRAAGGAARRSPRAMTPEMRTHGLRGG